MEHPNQRQQQHQSAGVLPASGQIPYTTPYQTTSMVATGSPAVPVSSPTQLPTTFPPQQLPFPPFHNPQQQQQQLQLFWANQMREVEQTNDFKNHSLPLARIKKIMKADEDVRMISAEAPVIFAKACEMFILELTLRSWIHTEENKRRTLQKNDIAAAISRTDVFDFLVDIIPRDDLTEGLGVIKGGMPLVGSPNDGLPYYYMPQPGGAGGMMMGKLVDQSAMYSGQEPQAPLPFMPWSQSQPPQQQPPLQQPPQQQQSDS